MFQKPEEILMGVIALLWLGLNYYLAAWATSASVFYTFLIVGLIAAWTVAIFYVWHKDKLNHCLPVFAGLLVGCWTPWLNYFAGENTTAWYVTWTMKIVLMILPMIGGYVWQYKRNRTRRLHGLM